MGDTWIIAHGWKKKGYISRNGSIFQKRITCKNGSHLQQWVTLEKICPTRKVVSHCKKWVKSGSHLQKGSHLENLSHIETESHFQK